MNNPKLIIAEKKDVAMKLKKYYEKQGKTSVYKDGYVDIAAETPDPIRITWARGHILTLYEPEDYKPELKVWSTKTLPIIPETFKHKPLENSKKQYDILNDLIEKADIIINAGDPDREGQVLIDELLENVRDRKDIQRLLLSGLNDELITDALANLKPNDEFYGLYRSGVLRSDIDWLIGINLTRHFSILRRQGGGYGELVKIGRVKTPTVALVVKREREIKNFKPETWYTVNANIKINGIDIKAQLQTKEKIKDKAKAEEIKKSIEKQTFLIQTVTPSHHEESVNALYQLNTLQVDADKYCGIDASKTSEVAETLYLAGYTTYPRTECKYLPESQEKDAPEIIAGMNEKISSEVGILSAEPDEIMERAAKSPVYDDKKLGPHHAIIPTKKIPDLESKELSEEEKAIYLLIARKFLSVFYPPYAYDQLKVTGTVKEQTLAFTCKKENEGSWKTLYAKYGKKDKTKDPDQNVNIPLQPGRTYIVQSAEVKSQTSKPPKPYTEATLIAAMAGIKSEDETLNSVLKEIKGIGTSATQSQTIEDLLKEKKNTLLFKKGKEIHPTDLAMRVTDLLPPVLTNPDYTAKMEIELAKIADSKDKEEQQRLFHESLQDTIDFVTKIITDIKKPLYVQDYPCPICKKGYVIYYRWPDKEKNLVQEYSKCNNPECGKYFPVQNGKPRFVKCPSCETGYMMEKKNKAKNTIFYGCSNYPACKKTMAEEEFKKTK